MRTRRANISVIVGMAMFWPYLLPHPYRLALAGLGEASGQVAALFGAEFPLVLAVLFATAYRFGDSCASLARKPSSALAAGIAGTAGMAALNASTVLAGELAVALQACGVFLIGWYLVAGLIVWGVRLLSDASYATSLARSAAAVALGDLLLGATYLTVGALTSILIAGTPLATMALAALTPVAVQAPIPATRVPTPAQPLGRADLMALFAASTLLVYFNSFFASVLGALQEASGTDGRVTTLTVSCAIMIAMALLCLKAPDRRAGVFLAFASMLVAYLIALFVILLAAHGSATVDYQLWVAAGISFKAFVLAFLCSSFTSSPAQGVRLFSAYGVALVAVPFFISLGSSWSGSLFQTLFPSSDDALAIAQVALFAVAVASVVAMASRMCRPAETPGDTATPARQGKDDASARLHALAEQTRLSEREQQVVSYLLRGYSAKAIATKLSLSEHTVNNHMSSAYRKIGIHSRQELVTLLDEPEADGETCSVTWGKPGTPPRGAPRPNDG